MFKRRVQKHTWNCCCESSVVSEIQVYISFSLNYSGIFMFSAFIMYYSVCICIHTHICLSSNYISNLSLILWREQKTEIEHDNINPSLPCSSFSLTCGVQFFFGYLKILATILINEYRVSYFQEYFSINLKQNLDQFNNRIIINMAGEHRLCGV